MSTVKFLHKEVMYSSIDEIKVSMILEPGDEFQIPLKNGQLATAVFGKYTKDGHRRFVFKDCIAEHVMNDEPTNEGGYFKSELRRYVLEDLLPLLPDQLREALEPRVMCEIVDGETQEYADALWIPSATDVFGDGEYWELEPDSEQLDIFKRERDRVKELGDKGTWYWWLRSPYRSNSTRFVVVYISGDVNGNFASLSCGVAPGFDL